jgi:hypothetical protein
MQFSGFKARSTRGFGGFGSEGSVKPSMNARHGGVIAVFTVHMCYICISGAPRPVAVPFPLVLILMSKLKKIIML